MDSISTEQFLETIKNLDRRISGLERTTQPQLIDWYEMNPSFFSYIGLTNYIKIDFSCSYPFQVGDRIQLFQDNQVKSFYITDFDVASPGLWAIGDTDFSSGTISWFKISKLPAPSDFPGSMSYSSDVYVCDSSSFTWSSYIPDGLDLIYTMMGNVVHMGMRLYATNFPPSKSSIALSLPFIGVNNLSGHGSYQSVFGDTTGGYIVGGDVGKTSLHSGIPTSSIYVWVFSTISGDFNTPYNITEATITFTL